MKAPRDVLAERIEGWAGEASVYDYADRLLKDLCSAGYEVVACGPDEVTISITPHQVDVVHTALEFAKQQCIAWKLVAETDRERLEWSKRIRELRVLIGLVTRGR